MRFVLVLFCLCSFVFAHKLNIFITQENNTIYINSYFASGAACQNCKVAIYDERDALIKKGETDTKGDFIFEAVSKPIEVQVDAGSGHLQMRAFNPKITTQNSLENNQKKVFQEALSLEKEQNNMADMLKGLLGLVSIAFIFFVLKRVKR